jgi:uncharacterized membrane protein YesL
VEGNINKIILKPFTKNYAKMKKISNITIIGYIFGSLFSLLSAIRYYVLYPDLDKVVVYVLIGFMICIISFLYNKTIESNNEINAISEYLADKLMGEKNK